MYLKPEPELGWLPTHVQVTILQARGLRAKGKHGTSDAFTLIQIGREKYSTSVVEKTSGAPEWKEECSFELAPGALERGERCELQLTIMHRALIGMDQFLGQVCIHLLEVYKQGRSLRNQWYKLCSKPGRKEKERGEIQVSIQFTRNNLTASMFDLSIKDKPKTPFGKLKDKMKVKKLFDMESSSAIVPSNVGRLDSDDEDDRKPKSKAAFFLKGRLRRSSLTKSNTSLGSDSTVSSASGTVPTSTGISIVVPDAGKKPAARNSSLSSELPVKDHEASPRMTHKRAFSDEVSQLKMFPDSKAIQDLKPTGSPISKSSLCINGSHVYSEVPLPKASPNPLEKSTPQSKSFQNFVKKTDDPVGHGHLSGSEKPDWKQSTPPTVVPEVAKNLAKTTEQPPKSDDVRHEFKPIHITTPLMFSENAPNTKTQESVGKEEKKPKVNLFQYGTNKSESGEKGSDQGHHGSTHAEERGKAGGWFGSKDTKDTPQKPSLDVSPQVETSSSAYSGFTLDFLSHFSVPSPVDGPVCMPVANHIAASYSGVCGSLPVNNPFLNALQNNPFFEDLLSDQLLNTSSPTRFSSSFPSGSIAASEAAEWGSSLVEEHSPPAFAPEDKEESSDQRENVHGDTLFDTHKSKSAPSSTFEPTVSSEWEDQFDAFASSRLNPATERHRLLETKVLHSNDSFLNSGFSIEGAEKSPAVSEHSVNILPGVYKSNPAVHILETHWPVNLPEAQDPKSEDSSPFDVRYYAPHIPTVESTRIQTPDNDSSSTSDHSKAMFQSENPQRGFDSNKPPATWSSDEPLSITECSKSKSIPQEPLSPNVCDEDMSASVTEVKDHGTLHNPGETAHATIRIAEVSPLLFNECSVAELRDFCSSQTVGQQSSSQCSSVGTTETDITGNAIQQVVVRLIETLPNPVEAAQVATISYKSDAVPNDDIIKTVVGGWVNEPEVRLPLLRETVGSMMAPKPPWLLLSPTYEEKPSDRDNCAQTSNQDLSAKQMEHPEEQMLEKNNGVGKQMVSPVTCCPLIEVRSPVQSIGEDTQSTTEGILANLKIGNNDLTKLAVTNGEHLLDVNESTLAEQFWTCPSKVSLDVLDLSSADVSSNKLDVLKLGSEIISNEPSKPVTCEKLLKPLPVSKNEQDGLMEPSQSVDHSALFWSALEQPLPVSPSDPLTARQDEANAQRDTVVPECEQIIRKGLKVENNSGNECPVLDITRRDVANHALQSSAKELTAEDQSGLSLSHMSSWSADIVVDFKNEGFWKSESDLLEGADTKSLPSPSNPFISDKTPPPVLSERNPFAERSQSTQSSEVSLQDNTSFKDLHGQAAFKALPPTALPTTAKILSLHDRQPLAFSTPSLVAAQNTKLSDLPSPILFPTTSAVTGPTNTNAAALTCFQSPPVAGCGVKSAVPSVLPKETLPAETPLIPLRTSPHPVKPISATLSDSGQEKKPSKPALSTALSSGLEKLKSVAGGHPQTAKTPDLDRFKDLCSPDVAAKYYHLTHDELIHMLLQREAELGRKDEHVHELEDYIDKLLVRIMEQAPTLLQAPLETKKDKK